MTFGFGFGFPRRVGAGGFSPASLFAAGEVGAWYDPSDLTTLFQDTAGTTPVTTPGQVVALMLDKSRGLALGPQLVTNGTFDTNIAGWTSQAGSTISWVSGSLEGVASSGSSNLAFQDITTVSGRSYRYTATVRCASGNINVDAWLAGFGGLITRVTANAPTTNQTVSLVFVAGGTTTRIGLGPSVATTFYLDNISVRELPGNHATQATAASRPTYGIVPRTGRRNFILYSNTFSNAAWVKTNATLTANAATDPVGGNNAWRFQTSGVGIIRQFTSELPYSTGVRQSIYVRSNTGSSQTFALKQFWNNPISLTATTAWQRFDVVSTENFSDGGIFIEGTNLDLLIFGAQLETATTPSAYQQTTTRWDVTEAGVQSLAYLGFDGVDDGMTTASFSWPGLYSVWAGVCPSKVTGIQMLATMDNGSGISGSRLPQFLRLNTSNPESIGFFLASPFADQGPSVAANTNYVLSANTISNQINVRVNTVSNGATSFTSPLNTDSRALTIGMFDLAFPGSYFLGNLYGLILRGAATDATNITNTETWMNGKTSAY